MADKTPKTPERKAAETAAADLAKRERRTARALLKVEQKNLARLRRSVQRSTESLVAAAAVGINAQQKIRQQAPTLQHDVHADVVVGRREARTAGRSQLEAELQRALQATSSLVADDAAAMAAAATIAGAWAATALATLSGEGPSLSNLAAVTKAVEGRIARTAVTETAYAFNDERNAILIEIGGTGSGPQAHEPLDAAQPGMFKVWSAVLDRVTCARCFRADGEVVELTKPFRGGESPPLHPFCRCVVEHVIVPKPERLTDIAIDYDLFKEELRDVIREGREISDRRALGFVSDSLGEGRKRSPLALTKRFANEPYATRRSPGH